MDSTTATDEELCGRRAGADRRNRSEPIAHPDRRKSERRSGKDRRTEARS